MFTSHLPGDPNILHGYFEIHHNQKLTKSGYYKDGKYHHVIKSYIHSSVSDVTEFSNGLRHGTQWSYSLTGNLMYKCEYKNSVKDGKEWKKGKGEFGQTWSINNNDQTVYRLQHSRNGGVIDEYPKKVKFL